MIHAVRSKSLFLQPLQYYHTNIQSIPHRCVILSRSAASPTLRQCSSHSSSASSVPPKNEPPLRHPDWKKDPQSIANKRVEARMFRGEGEIIVMTPQLKMRNFALATGLLGFVGWVFMYSVNSVGKAGGEGMLIEEAEEARAMETKKEEEMEDVEDLMGLEVTDKSLEGEIVGGGSEGLILSVAAPDEIARGEEERNLSARGSGDARDGKQPRKSLWRKIIFFWKKD